MANTFQLISKINKEMGQYIIDRLYEQDIKDLVLSHGSILLALSYVEEMNLQDLASKIGKSPQTITTLVRKLEREDYIVLKKKDTDKREKVVSLSLKGKEFMPIMNVISNSLFQVQYQGISKSEQEQLRDLLQRVLHNFQGSKTDVNN